MKRWTRNTIFAGVVVATAGGYLHRDVIPDKFLHEPTPQERLISDAYVQTLNTAVDVLCLPQVEINKRVQPFASQEPDKVKRAVTVPLWHLVWLNENICAGIDSFAQKADKTVATGVELAALRAVSHEASHILGNLFSEGQAECQAVQYVEPLTKALGASAAASQEIRKQVAQLVGNPSATSEDYVIPEGCVDGGPLDLDPTRPGIFPDQPTPSPLIKGW